MSRILANRLVFILALAGIFISLFLTSAHINAVNVPCGASNGCEKVAAHPSASGFGIPALSSIPTAAFGAMMYAALAVLAFARTAIRSERTAQWAGLLVFGLALIGVGVSAYLTYLEAFVIHAWCKWCVASAIVITLVFLIALAERFTRSATGAREALREVR